MKLFAECSQAKNGCKEGGDSDPVGNESLSSTGWNAANIDEQAP
jgi:hypothetical protein